jgi:hypothetical protein
MIEIRFKDIDPDTGKISNDKLIAISENQDFADWINAGLALTNESDPNREFYTRDLRDLERELTYEEKISWFIANYYETGMEYEGLLASLANEDLDNFKWINETIQFPRKFSEIKRPA